MTNSNDMPLAAKPIDRAAHHRKDDAWLDAAFARDDVLVLMLRNGEGEYLETFDDIAGLSSTRPGIAT